MIRELDRPWEDQSFRTMLSDYEQEMHGIDPGYPMGRTITFLDVEGFKTYVAEDRGHFAGFMVLETRNGECEIHEFYVIPEQRNSFVARALLNKAFDSCQKLAFNVFQSNVRARAFAELLLQMTAVDFKVSDTEIWGVKCLHYEMPMPLNYYNKDEKNLLNFSITVF